MFASQTIAAHLMRGAIAAALITWALQHQSSDPAFAVAAGVVAVIAMRGCPLCWTVGLVETIGERIRVRRGHTYASGCRSCS
jgi:hypothetical protein